MDGHFEALVERVLTQVRRRACCTAQANAEGREEDPHFREDSDGEGKKMDGDVETQSMHNINNHTDADLDVLRFSRRFL